MPAKVEIERKKIASKFTYDSKGFSVDGVHWITLENPFAVFNGENSQSSGKIKNINEKEVTSESVKSRKNMPMHEQARTEKKDKDGINAA